MFGEFEELFSVCDEKSVQNYKLNIPKNFEELLNICEMSEIYTKKRLQIVKFAENFLLPLYLLLLRRLKLEKFVKTLEKFREVCYNFLKAVF